MKLPEKQQLLIVTLAAVLLGGFLAFRYLPLEKRKNAAMTQDSEKVLSMEKVKIYTGEMPVLREKALGLEKKLASFDRKIPQNSSIAQLWQCLAELMKKHNLQDQVIVPGAEVKGKDLACLPLSIQCSGTLEQIYAFFSSLSAIDRLVRIDSVQMKNDENFTGQISLTFNADVYYRLSKSEGI